MPEESLEVRVPVVVFAALAALLLMPWSPASAQVEAGLAGDDGGHYGVSTTPRGVWVVLAGPARVAGRSRLQVPTDVVGRFRLEVREQGYETQRGALTLPGRGRPLTLTGPFPGIGAVGVLKSSILPGAAHIAQGDGARGWAWLVAGGTAVTGAIAAEVRVRSRRDDVLRARRFFDLSQSPSARVQTGVDLVRLEAELDGAERARRDYLIVAGAVWGLAAVDLYLWTPGLGGARSGRTEVQVDLRPLSRGKALLRSVIPGMGQHYAGRGNGWLHSFAGLASGYGLLITEHRYRETVSELAALQEIYDAPSNDPEVLVDLGRTLLQTADEAQSRRTERNVWLGVASGLWVLNLIDAYAGTPRPRAPEPLTGRLGVRVGATPERALGLVFAF